MNPSVRRNGLFLFWRGHYNQGTEQKTLRLKSRPVSSCSSWLLWSSCWSMTGMRMVFEEAFFSLPFILWLRTYGWLPVRWTFCAWLTWTLYNHCFHHFVFGEQLLLSLRRLCEEKKKVYWLEWIYFSIASLCNVAIMFIFILDLLKSQSRLESV